jgi:uncharacterized protein YfaS (alpha-2-macroglobulin family)
VDELVQGKTFVASVTVKNTSTRRQGELALKQVFPSGWEIRNARLAGSGLAASGTADYQDIRDDRVLSFFGLDAGASIRLQVELTAAYQGRFYLPAQLVEAMYDERVYARKAGQWVTVRSGNSD